MTIGQSSSAATSAMTTGSGIPVAAHAVGRVVRRRPGRGLLGAAGEADAVGAELGVAQVQPDPPGEPAALRPRLGHVAAGRPRPTPSPPPARARRGGVELADVVEQRGGEPPRVAGVLACRRARPRRRGRRRSRGAGRGSACAATARRASGAEHRRRPRRRRRRARRPRGDSAPKNRRGEVDELHRATAVIRTRSRRAGRRTDRGSGRRSR